MSLQDIDFVFARFAIADATAAVAIAVAVDHTTCGDAVVQTQQFDICTSAKNKVKIFRYDSMLYLN